MKVNKTTIGDLVLEYAKTNGYTHLASFSCFDGDELIDSCAYRDGITCGVMGGFNLDSYCELDSWAYSDCTTSGVFCGICPFHDNVLCTNSNKCDKASACELLYVVLGVKTNLFKEK